MSNTGNSIKREPIREIAAGTISETYQMLGTAFIRDMFRLWITNNTNGDIYLSTDGVTDMCKFPGPSARAADNKTNDIYDKAGTQWWIRYEATPDDPTGWFGLEAEYA